eukprot:2515107-Lingulodinium_polyedra.AAC.1
MERERPDRNADDPVKLEVFRAVDRHDAWQGQVQRHGPAQAWCLAFGYQQTIKCLKRDQPETAKIFATQWA